MMEAMELYYYNNYPDSNFSVNWNQIECLAHVVNLGAQAILLNFKHPVENDNDDIYTWESTSVDRVVSAVSRIS